MSNLVFDRDAIAGARFEPEGAGGAFDPEILTPPSTGQSITAAVGTFVLTGEPATLEHGNELVAAEGSFVLTGKAANLVHGFQVTAAEGSFSLTGEAANLLHGFVLSAARGL